jgi:hypothetical protein
MCRCQSVEADAVTEDLRLAFFIASQVVTDESDELAELDDGGCP